MMDSKKLAVFILTKNEGVHIERAIISAKKLTNNIYVVDSGSTDNTKEICEKNSVLFLFREWEGYSSQVNYAIDLLKVKYEWVIRLDADEYFNENFCDWIKNFNGVGFNGVYVHRSIVFEKKTIRFGGVGKRKVLRMFKPIYAFCEDRLNDEHIVVEGAKCVAKGDLFDENLKGFKFFLEKHITYAQLESKNFDSNEHDVNFHRKIKSSLYDKAPLSFRAIVYFLIRVFFQGGFFDGVKGVKFHFWQCLVYRLIVDEYIKESKYD